MRTGGYFLHACSHAAWSQCNQWTGTMWKTAERLEGKNIDGDPLDIYKIKLTVP